MNPINYVLLALLVISGVLTVILVLMHSGSGIWEKNLDRLTVITTTVFILCVIVMTLTFPTGTISF